MKTIENCGNCPSFMYESDDGDGWCNRHKKVVNRESMPDGDNCGYFNFDEDEND